MDERMGLFVRGWLLQVELEKEAALSENKLREIKGESPAYSEDYFLGLSSQVNTILDNIR